MGDVKITSGGKEYLDQAADLLSKVFHDDPVIRFMTSSLSDTQHLAYLPSYFRALLRAAMLNDAIFQEANNWACCAVWMLPGKRVDNPFTILQAGFLGVLAGLGVAGCKRMLWDFQPQADACKRTAMKEYRGYHYLFFIGTDFHARRQGLASQMVARYREQLVERDLPMWLEATTLRSRDIYAKCGFEVVREIVLGKGTHAASGVKERGGPGVSIWTMIWRPPVDSTREAPSSGI